jgi:hypothetical protein
MQRTYFHLYKYGKNYLSGVLWKNLQKEASKPENDRVYRALEKVIQIQYQLLK